MKGLCTHDMAQQSRREFIKYGAAAAGSLALAGCSGGGGGDDEFPNQKITNIIPYEPGGGTDTYLRQVGQFYPDVFDVNARYENVPGAAGMRGITQAAQAEPDGYTMVGVNPPAEVLPWLQDEDLQEQVDIRALEPVASVGYSSYCLIGHTDHNFDGFQDVIDRFQDGEFSQIGGTQAGGAAHIVAILMRDQMGLEWDDYIAYDGAAPTVEAVSSGEIPVGLPTSGTAKPAAEEGLVDPIVVGRSEGDNIFPNTPSVTDEGFDNIDFVGAVTRSLLAPPDTPQDRLDTLLGGIQEIVESDDMQEWSEDTGQGVAYLDQEGTRDVWHGGIKKIQEEIDLESIQDA